MYRLRYADLAVFSEALRRLYEPASIRDFPLRVHAAFGELFRHRCISFDVVDQQGNMVENAVNQSLGIPQEDFLQRWNQFASQHPSLAYLQNGGSRTVLQISDFLSERQFSETALYRECFCLSDSLHQLAAVIGVGERVIGVAVNRDKIFRGEEVALMELMQPHFAQAYQTACLLSAIDWCRPPLDFTRWRRHGFTRRECEVLQWLLEGKRNSEIAVILGCRPLTVKKHVEHILGKLSVETRAAAAARAREILGDIQQPGWAQSGPRGAGF